MESISFVFILSTIWTVVLSVLGFLAVRTLKQIDANQKQLSEDLKEMRKDYHKLSEDFYQMRGEHYVNHGRRATDIAQR